VFQVDDWMARVALRSSPCGHCHTLHANEIASLYHEYGLPACELALRKVETE